MNPVLRIRSHINEDSRVPLVYPSTHPLIHNALADLRATKTGPAEFRSRVRAMAMMLAVEATADLPTRSITVRTPLGEAQGRVLAEPVGIVPILRAGLGMVDGVLDLIPDAEVWHLGLFRDEATLMPVEYYNKWPRRSRVSIALVIDPMLATGGSVLRACEIIKASGLARLKVIALIAAPEGLARLAEAMPDVPVHVGAIDDRLNEVGFIHPGLGDAGDRQFGTGPD